MQCFGPAIYALLRGTDPTFRWWRSIGRPLPGAFRDQSRKRTYTSHSCALRMHDTVKLHSVTEASKLAEFEVTVQGGHAETRTRQ